MNNSGEGGNFSLLSNGLGDSGVNSDSMSSKRVRTNSQSSVHSQNRSATPTLKKELECCLCKNMASEKFMVK